MPPYKLPALLAQYNKIYAAYLKERPWHSRVGSWAQMAAGFYRLLYDHYPKVSTLLHQQGAGV